MTTILFIILAAVVTAFPFPDSTTTLTLLALNSSQDIPPRHPCSCQLLTFSVYHDLYLLRVHTDLPDHSWVAVQIRSSSECLVQQLDSTQTAQMQISSTKYNGYEITQSYLVEFFTPNPQDLPYNCSSIQEQGQERTVYLINRTKEEQEGQYHYIINLPKKSIAVTQLLSFLLLCLLCHNIRYRKFMPIRFNFIFVFVYAIFLFATIYVDTLAQTIVDIAFWVTMLLSLLCTLLYVFDLSSACFNNKTTIFTISLTLLVVVGVADLVVLPDGWPVNNLIAVLVAGTLIKFVVIKRLKSSLLPLLFLWIFFVFRQFIVLFHFQNFQQALHIKIVPLFLQIPGLLGDEETGFLCSAFGTSKIITMGLILNYCVRVDLFLSTRFYTILSTLTAFFCLLLQYLIMIMADDLPVLEYASVITFLPISFILILLLSSKRGEWAQLWHGSFHDIAIDRKSIKRESASILDDDQLDRNLQKLKMNPSLLTN